jgi:hypothetical protein
MIVKRILCLANSKKHSGRCVAGREITAAGAGPWIRPVSDRPGEEVSEYERQYENGADPKPLDVIDVPLIEARPHACQTENWLLDPNRYWRLVRRVEWDELQQFVEAPASLWVNGQSTFHGLNDEIPQEVADQQPGSLYLIRVDSVILSVFPPGGAFGNPKRRVQARFAYADVEYALWVTDPLVEREYLKRPDGNYEIGECCLTISLGEPFQKNNGQWCRYKLVAAIIRHDGGRWP